MKHALLSASGASRWLNCTPSARLEERLPENTSIYAEEGTLAHELADLTNKYNFSRDKMTKTKFNRVMTGLKENPLYSEEMEEHISEFCTYIREEFRQFKLETKDPFISFEERLDYSKYVPEGFGTGDAVIITDGTLKLIDLKYGKGVPVSAQDNKQLMLYALGAYEKYGFLYDIDTIEMTIYQPRLDNIDSYTMPVDELLEWANGELADKAKLAYDGAGEYKAGEHCKFCKAKAICRARAEENLKLQSYEYKTSELLSNGEIADILKIAERLINWANDVNAYALSQALQGEKFEGFKVVEGRSTRKYADENAVVEKLYTIGYSDDQLFEMKLIGVSSMEKLIGKRKFSELIGEYVHKPKGKPTLAPTADKREEYNSAEYDFKDVVIEG